MNNPSQLYDTKQLGSNSTTIQFLYGEEINEGLSVYYYLWLRYIHGFSPKYHCQRSLLGRNDKRFFPKMDITKTYELYPKHSEKYMYLCGQPKGSPVGLHLAFIPNTEGEISYITVNNIEVRISNAIQLEIPPLPEGYGGMFHSFTSCRNWQFGVKYFGFSTDKGGYI
jgi:hypothetical protein